MESGTRLGPYEILEQLGAGGMGEVYRARDTKLDRDVAIKVLPEDFATDPDRLARFEREAKLLASLNHPNIATIHGFDESDGVRFIAMELVEGESLAQRIASAGSLEVEEALEIARQIALALEAAHGAGVVHRDLKPANVVVTPDGTAKVLDFGLAKVPGASGPSSDLSPDLTQSPTVMAATGTGVVMGTAAYMSPEQARGLPVDHRTDIWAFGCVLYEMLVGRGPFAGQSLTDVLAAIIKETPDDSLLPAETPGGVRLLLRRCLTKDPRNRLQHIGDARLELSDPRSDAPEVPFPSPAGARFSTANLAFVGVAAALLAGIGVWIATGPPEMVPPPTARFSFVVPDGLRVVADDPDQDGPWLPYPPFTLSRDGSSLVYLAATSEGKGDRQLYLRSRDEIVARPLPGTENADMPFFSPDGAWVGFWAGGTLLKVAVEGGQPVTIARLPRRPRGAAWVTDDTIVIGGVNRGLQTVDVSAGTAQKTSEVTIPDGELGHRYHAWPSVLPGGEAVLFTAVAESDADVLAVYSLESGTVTFVEGVQGATQGHYLESGHLVFYRSGSLFAAPFDPEQPSTVEGDMPILEVATGWNAGMFFGLFAVSPNGTLVYGRAENSTAQNTIVLVDDKGLQSPLPGVDPGGYTYRPTISPDGTKLVVSNITDRPSSDLWVHSLESFAQQRLTTADANIWPLWSVDGAELFYSEFATDSFDLTKRSSADGRVEPTTLYTAEYEQFPSDLSADGRWLAYTHNSPVSGHDIWLLALEDAASPSVWLESPANESEAAISPDGRYIAYTSDVTGQRRVYVAPFSGEGAVVSISSDRARSPRWSPDGALLFYLRERDCLFCDDTMMSVRLELEPVLSGADTPRPLFRGRYDSFFDIIPAGPLFVEGSPRFVMLTREVQQLDRLDWVLNWSTEVAQRVPAR